MIYTSYFAKLKELEKNNIIPISICTRAPDWYRGLQYKKLAPKYGFFMEWKKTHDNDYYIEHFEAEVLDKLDTATVVKELNYLVPNVNGKDTGVVDDDVFVRGDNYYVKAYQSTASGTLQDKYSESETATNYARVMKFGAFTVSAYTAKYKVRAYAILEDGTYVYSKLVNFSVFDVASYMYDNRIMSTKAEHDYLYDKILTKVQPDYKYIDKDWSPIVKPVSFRMIP